MQPDGGRKRILIAEDDASIRELIYLRLALTGYLAVGTRNGVEAMREMETRRPDGLVLDLGMPELDGFGVLEQMSRRGLAVPTLVLTARHCAGDVEKAVKLGAVDYLAKPFDDKDFLRRVERMVRGGKPCSAPSSSHQMLI